MPHIMKRNILFPLSLALVAILAVSCETKSVISPTIQASTILYRTSATGVKDTISFLDTLHVGDTVLMPLRLDGYFDYLTTFKAVADTEKVQLAFVTNAAFDSCLTSAANPKHGYLVFEPARVYGCYVPLSYVPLRVGTHKVELDLNSAAEEAYSHCYRYFNIEVR